MRGIFELSEANKRDMYGDMTEEEIAIVYKGQGNYKGWKCIYLGVGSMMFVEQNQSVKAYRGDEVKNWVPECWKECKQKIDKIEK